MKSIFTLTLLFAFSTGASPRIVDEMTAANRGWGDMSAKLQMVNDDGNGKTSTRKMRLKAKETQKGSGHSLLVFDGPADVKGTALLSRAGDGHQFLYLPALKRARRIAGGNRSGAFVGSEFAYEDVTGLEKEAHSWTDLGEEACGKAMCAVVEARPKYKGSGYARRVLYVDQDKLVPKKVVFFDKDNKKLKTLRYNGYKQYEGKFWRASEWVMNNHKSGRSTTLSFSGYAFDQNLADNLFTKRALKRVR